MTAPALPALALTLLLGVAASLAEPGPLHSSHHPQEQSGTMGAIGRVAASLALRWSYPR